MSNEITLEQVYGAVLDLAQATGNMDVRLTGELKGVNRRLDGVETRLTGVETRLTGVETRLTGVETRLTGVETRLGNVENRVEGLEGRMVELTTVVRSVDRRLSVVEAR